VTGVFVYSDGALAHVVLVCDRFYFIHVESMQECWQCCSMYMSVPWHCWESFHTPVWLCGRETVPVSCCSYVRRCASLCKVVK